MLGVLRADLFCVCVCVSVCVCACVCIYICVCVHLGGLSTDSLTLKFDNGTWPWPFLKTDKRNGTVVNERNGM